MKLLATLLLLLALTVAISASAAPSTPIPSITDDEGLQIRGGAVASGCQGKTYTVTNFSCGGVAPCTPGGQNLPCPDISSYMQTSSQGKQKITGTGTQTCYVCTTVVCGSPSIITDVGIACQGGTQQ